MKKRAENEDISIDLDTGEEILIEEDEASITALKAKIKALRRELQDTQKERDENLAGWQRTKADLVNFRKSVDEDTERNKVRAKVAIVRKVVPVLDSFSTAMRDVSWKEVDAVWREGVERIANQMFSILESEGLTRFGMTGERFDPTIHECMSVVGTEREEEDDTIAQVFQEGYTIGSELVRPAKVVVAQLQT